MKAVELIGRSLRVLRVIDPFEPVDPVLFENAVTALNGMLTRWEANGVSLGWQNVSQPDDVLPLPPEAEEAVMFNLAVTLRPEFGATMDQDTLGMAKNGLNALRRENEVATPIQPILDAPAALPYGATYFGFGDLYY